MVTRVSQLDPQRMETERSSRISRATGNRFGALSTLRETDEIALADLLIEFEISTAGNAISRVPTSSSRSVGLMDVYVVLRVGNRAATLLEFFFELSGQIESQTPVIFLATPGSNHQVYRGIGKFRDGDDGFGVREDTRILAEYRVHDCDRI
jgi:hypothetical protein